MWVPLSPVCWCLQFLKVTLLPYVIPADSQTSLILSPSRVLLMHICSPAVVSDLAPCSISWFHGHFCADFFVWLVPAWSFPETSSCLPSFQRYEIRGLEGRELLIHTEYRNLLQTLCNGEIYCSYVFILKCQSMVY